MDSSSHKYTHVGAVSNCRYGLGWRALCFLPVKEALSSAAEMNHTISGESVLCLSGMYCGTWLTELIATISAQGPPPNPPWPLRRLEVSHCKSAHDGD